MSQDHIASPRPTQPNLVADSLLSSTETTSSLQQITAGIDAGDAAAVIATGQDPNATRAVLSVPPIHVAPPVNTPTEPAVISKIIPEQLNEELRANQHSLLPSAAPPRPLPSLLRYVDHELMQSADVHNHPPHPNATCPVCFFQWDSPITTSVGTTRLPYSTPHPTSAATSTFLPLSPCGHWMHYRCLILLATRTTSDRKDKCFVCHTQLFEWDGITALTLATRTGLELGDENKNPGYLAPLARELVAFDKAEYVSECALIDSVINQRFFAHLNQPSKFADHSPDLIRCYYEVLNELHLQEKPQAKWLRWTTDTGSLLFSMLIAIKMRRFLVEGHAGIMQTEAWKEFEEGGKALQARILGEVHKP